MLMNCHSLTPALPPIKLQLLPFGQVSLDRIVDTLDDHVLDARASQQVGHGRGVAKWIHWPTGVGLNTWRKEWSRCQGGLQPDHHMAFSAKFTASLSHGFQCKVHSLTITWLSVQSSQPHYYMGFSVSSQFPWATCQNWRFLFFPAMEMVNFGKWPCFIVLRTED